MPSKRNVVAVIDDNLGILGAMSRLLAELGYRTELYASAQEFLDAALLSEAHCLIVDIQLGESCGIELVRGLANSGFAIPITTALRVNSDSGNPTANFEGGTDLRRSLEDVVQCVEQQVSLAAAKSAGPTLKVS